MRKQSTPMVKCDFFLGFCKKIVPSTTDLMLLMIRMKAQADLSPEVLIMITPQRCANDAAGVFALFALAATSINVMIDFAFT